MISKNSALCCLLLSESLAYSDTISVKEIGNINNTVVKLPVKFNSHNVKNEKFDSFSLLKTAVNVRTFIKKE